MKASALILIMLAHHALAADFPTNITAETIELDNLSLNYNDFEFQWGAFEDVKAQFTIKTDSTTFLDLTGWLLNFRLEKRVSGSRSNNVYLTLDDTAITISLSNATFTVARSSMPSNGSYLGELLLMDSTTNVVRPIARGRVNVTQSLFR